MQSVSIAPLWNWKTGRLDHSLMSMRVSIAPLWNWKVILRRFLSSLPGFNRTFMELKGHFRLAQNGGPAVSIAPLWNWKYTSLKSSSRAMSSFNRTFMELKEQRICARAKGHAFQSHLYGIESRKLVGLVADERVSIAPLWNWKFSAVRCLHPRSSFNRTFMELKARR